MSAILLAIDTAGSSCAACVYDMTARKVLARAEPDIGRGHAERLIGIVDEVLRDAGLDYADIAKVAAVIGPGSFTGLRVGVAAARALALALTVPAVGVSTLEALAEPFWNEAPAVLSIMDARRGEVYAALYGADGAVLCAPAAVMPAALAAFVAPELPADMPLIVVGSGTVIALSVLGRANMRGVNETGVVDIAAVARIAARRADAPPPRPLYLREADAKRQEGAAIARA